ncbi:hypothetical protein BT69DRAFT_1278637 [Atractiella rhizophila]|nr:hypothetical protein BT69DRAFT_1278637 [Atractiella rhizophila]
MSYQSQSPSTPFADPFRSPYDPPPTYATGPKPKKQKYQKPGTPTLASPNQSDSPRSNKHAALPRLNPFGLGVGGGLGSAAPLSTTNLLTPVPPYEPSGAGVPEQSWRGPRIHEKGDPTDSSSGETESEAEPLIEEGRGGNAAAGYHGSQLIRGFNQPVGGRPSFESAGSITPRPSTDSQRTETGIRIVYTPTTKIYPSSLTKKQLEVYNGFCNKDIDKEGRPKNEWTLIGDFFWRGGWRRIPWKDFGRTLRKWFTTWKYLKWIIAIIVFLVAIGLLIIYQENIVDGLTPFGNRLKDLRGGFLIPVALIIVLSFPPLTGAEIVFILAGVIWGLGIGFAISAAGTLVGEIANFYVFRWLLRNRAERYERKSFEWAAISYIVRKGGFKIVLAVRYSVIPNNISTTIFSTTGVGFWSFTNAAILSLPQILTLVYTGVYYKNTGMGMEASTVDKILFPLTTALNLIITAIVAFYIQRVLRDATIPVRQILRIRRAQALNDAENPYATPGKGSSMFKDMEKLEAMLPEGIGRMPSSSTERATRLFGWLTGSGQKRSKGQRYEKVQLDEERNIA